MLNHFEKYFECFLLQFFGFAMCKLKFQNINGFNKCFQPVCPGLSLTHLSGADSNLSDTAKQTFSFENQRSLCLTESSIVLLKNKGYSLELLLK
jgi:hypothetical protein